MVHIVGAGPGAEDLITVRGLKFLKQADIVIYAGSLVNPGLLKETKQGAVIYDSAKMTLEQVMEVIEQAWKEQKEVVRLHTGDPCLYGAIREQMDAMDKSGIKYDICPGVSSFCGTAAALQMEYTLPGISQSVIITRMAGKDTGAGKREHPPVCFSSGNHGDLFKYGNVKRTVKGINGRGYSPIHQLLLYTRQPGRKKNRAYHCGRAGRGSGA